MKFSQKDSVFIGLLALLSILVVFVDVYFYRVYREKLIVSEQEQLMTMAETIGGSLNNAIESELRKIDFYFDKSDMLLPEAIKDYLEKNPSVFEGAVPEEGNASGAAYISGKHLSDSGWYVLDINKDIETPEGVKRAHFLMDLNEIYKRIVAPVKIGKGGYSVVKDKSLAIIMHHAKNQIGMDAIYDRKEQYPELDLRSLEAWLQLQRVQDKGASVIDTYVWDDPKLSSVERIVAFTTVDISGEKWIVNSTMPMKELDEPLSDMLFVILTLTCVYFFIIAAVVVMMNRSQLRSEAQKKEIRYLREINQGMEEVARQNDEIRHYQRIESLGMMASHIAHEFNNYLTPVMVYAELMENAPDMEEKWRKMAGEIMKSTDRAAKLSRELLDFSRQDSGADLRPLNLRKETEEAAAVIKSLTPQKISLSVSIMPEDMNVMARDGMMQHILMNLCKNAFQAMEESERKELNITLRKEDNGAVMTVSDTGSGISGDAQERIFEPFYTTKGSRHGTGLGLSVVRNIMHSMGGTISVSSEQGKGTCFTMFFPESDGSGSKKSDVMRKIVYIDKDELFTEDLKKDFLKVESKKLEFMTDEMRFLSTLQKDPERWDTVIVSYSLENMNGIECLEIIRKLNPKIFLILACSGDDADLEWYVKNGIIDRIVTKDKLREVLGQ